MREYFYISEQNVPLKVEDIKLHKHIKNKKKGFQIFQHKEIMFGAGEVAQ